MRGPEYETSSVTQFIVLNEVPKIPKSQGARMTCPQELLYSVFESHLFNADSSHQTVEALAETVVEDYLGRLMTHGWSVPHKFLNFLADDLLEEVTEMARKKTYGHSSLAEFRASSFSIMDSSRKRSI
jgi:hypothetical protein